ncbi:hypothetical protein KC726_04520 [Candidatus Woesebacteria bacterium]|nr:hypothetical protein [Candidatus Woesebacteria bacterium]
MAIPTFGARQIKKCLRNLGFTILKNRGKGGHDLAQHPTRKPYQNQLPHITIPHAVEYSSKTFRHMMIREIEAFGFTRKQVLQAFKRKVV